MTALKSKETAIIVRSRLGDATRRRRPELEALIIVWHYVLPELVMRVVSDEKFIKALDRELEIFNYFIPATDQFAGRLTLSFAVDRQLAVGADRALAKKICETNTASPVTGPIAATARWFPTTSRSRSHIARPPSRNVSHNHHFT